MKKSELRLLIREEIRKIIQTTKTKQQLKEYFVNSSSKVKDVLGINVFSDCYDRKTKISQYFISDEYGTKEEFAKWMKIENQYNKICQKLDSQLKPYYNQKIPAELIKSVDKSWYDGSYDDFDMIESLPKIYDKQINVIKILIAALDKAK